MKFTESIIFKELGKYDLIELETIGNFYFFDYFVVAEINEGAEFIFEKSRKLFDLAFEKYKGLPIGYISNRTNSYTSHPSDYVKVNNYLPSLIVFAAVTYNKASKNFTDLERKFCKKRFENFSKIENAIDWVTEIVKKERLKNNLN